MTIPSDRAEILGNTPVSRRQVDLINAIRRLTTTIAENYKVLELSGSADPRLLAIGKTQIEIGLTMWEKSIDNPLIKL